MNKNKLFVGNLPWSITSDSLKEMFAQFGDIVEAIIITDRMSGRSKGFGFVTFATEDAAGAAMQAMNEKDMEQLAHWIIDAVKSVGNENKLAILKSEIESFCSKFPVPGI